MTIPKFLQDQIKKGEKKVKKAGKDFNQRCLMVLEQIQKLDPERFEELNRIFRSKFENVKFNKKDLLGFYGQLNAELKKLKQPIFDSAQATLQAAADFKEIAKKQKDVIKHEAQKVKKEVQKAVSEGIKDAKNKAKSAKQAGSTVKKAAKKTAKKAANKVAKKTAKVAKKTAKKVAKKVSKKTQKKSR